MAEDHGIRISNAGKSAMTDADVDMALTTKFSIPKAVNWEEVDLASVGDPFDYPHRAEFIPFVLIYATANGSTNKVMASYFNYNDPDNVLVWASANGNNIKIYTGGTPDNKKVQVYAFVPEI